MARRAVASLIVLACVLAGCTDRSPPGTGSPGPLPVGGPVLPAYGVVDAAFVKGNGSFGAVLRLPNAMDIDITAHAAQGEWLLVGRQSPAPCSPVPVGMSAPFQAATLAAGDYVMLAQTGSETELGFATFSGGDDFEVDMPGGPWNGTVTRQEVPLTVGVPPTTWEGTADLDLARPAVVVVAVGTYAPVVTPASTATVAIGGCTSATTAFDPGLQPYPVWRAVGAFVPSGALSIVVQVEGNADDSPPGAYVTVAAGDRLAEALAGPGPA